MSESKAMILGCGGLALSESERAFYRAQRPWGFILFSRNIENASQVKELVADLRDCIADDKAPILIDQEGGRVQRLCPPLAPSYPPARRLGDLYRADRDSGLRAAWLMSRLHALDLQRLSVNVDCLPVLDVPVEGCHDVIGDRAYGHDPKLVAELGRAAMDGLMSGGVLPVIKHIPGHGRAFCDSHHLLPVVDASFAELERSDFMPFRALHSAPMAMTAHVVYSAIDPDNPATTSRLVIDEIIRGRIGFDGLLMSDDVSMNALSGDFATRTRAIVAAGCDVVLHCNGVMDEMQAVTENTPILSGDSARRAEEVRSLLVAGEMTDEASLRSEFDQLISAGPVPV
jgi:beta-N-acetylhexosaminidase